VSAVPSPPPSPPPSLPPSLKADASSGTRDAARAGSVLDTKRHDVPSGGSAMFVAASSLQNARSMHGVDGTAMHGNALRMFLQITVRCPHQLQDNFLAGLHS
jgi:hypothetical protein